MAMFMKDNDFRCECGCIEFEKKTYRAYSVNKNVVEQKDILVEYNARDVLVCKDCGKEHDPMKLNLTIM